MYSNDTNVLCSAIFPDGAVKRKTHLSSVVVKSFLFIAPLSFDENLKKRKKKKKKKKENKSQIAWCA